MAHFNITAISIEDAIDLALGKRSAEVFNFQKLEAEFEKNCPDYSKELTRDVGSAALRFALDVIFDVGPVARNVKKNETDKTWKFVSSVNVSDDKDKDNFIVSTSFEVSNIQSEMISNFEEMTIKESAGSTTIDLQQGLDKHQRRRHQLKEQKNDDQPNITSDMKGMEME